MDTPTPEKIYPDTAEGAKSALIDLLEPKLDFSRAEVYPDQWVEGVWAIKNVKVGKGYYFTDYIVYLAGYKNSFGEKRGFNDCEEVEPR